ncbi:MAG: S-methyl-5-thioribose-1-phosphate isomerase [Pseudomonadota bacterium]
MKREILSPIRWDGQRLELLDQRLLPGQEVWLEHNSVEEVAEAIERMVIRGAPAIGCAAAFGIALAARQLAREHAGQPDAFRRGIAAASARLAATRPTAVNLFWALDRMRAAVAQDQDCGQSMRASSPPSEHLDVVLQRLAEAIWQDDIDRCVRLGRAGAELIPDGATVLTHCNAGALATGGYGTALGVVRAAHEAGKRIRVLADETRPFLQGARLTAWELLRDGIDVTVVPDSAAASLMQRGLVTCVVVGADRIAANGDTANKIGTYGVALAAKEHGIPFYVAAPLSTVDSRTPTGAGIPIEERASSEVTHLGGVPITPPGAKAMNPAFDVTPARLISAIITETGVHRPPFKDLHVQA